MQVFAYDTKLFTYMNEICNCFNIVVQLSANFTDKQKLFIAT